MKPPTPRYLYFLPHQALPFFKIGISVSPIDRANQLFWDVDTAKALQFEFPYADARKAERTLHFLLRKWRFTMSARKAGRTEWFKNEGLQPAKRLIWHHREFFGWSEWTYVANHKLKERPSRPLPISDPPELRSYARRPVPGAAEAFDERHGLTPELRSALRAGNVTSIRGALQQAHAKTRQAKSTASARK